MGLCSTSCHGTRPHLSSAQSSGDDMRLYVAALLLAAHYGVSARGGGGTRTSGGGGSRTSGGGSHSYPHSTGYSGTGSGGTHTYPHSNGLSGNSRGHDTNNYYQHNSARYHSGSKTEVHHHYHYSPPQQISYGAAYHPVYRGTPPVYVYQYRDSGSRFDNLLTGLALYNLGRMSANNHHYHSYDSYNNNHYSGTPGEICKLGISKPTGEYEETRIDCKLMSSFILDASTSQNEQHVLTSNSVTTTVTNITHSGNGTGSDGSTSVITVKNETVTDALKAKGASIPVTPGMICYMIRIYRDTSTLKKNVPCGLLQEYAQRSMRRNSSERLKPVTIVLNFLVYYCFHMF